MSFYSDSESGRSQSEEVESLVSYPAQDIPARVRFRGIDKKSRLKEEGIEAKTIRKSIIRAQVRSFEKEFRQFKVGRHLGGDK